MLFDPGRGGGLKRLLAGSAEGMATTSGLRRAIVRGDVEALASAVHADRPLPPLYFVLAASSTEEQDHYAVTYLLKVRTNWLVRTPAGSGITWESLVNSEGEAADFRSCLEGPAVDGTPGRPIASHAGLGESLVGSTGATGESSGARRRCGGAGRGGSPAPPFRLCCWHK